MLMMFVRNYLRNEKGQGMVEYGLILALISIAAIAVMTPIGTQITSVFQKVTDALTAAL